jgi:hypothetical protein
MEHKSRNHLYVDVENNSGLKPYDLDKLLHGIIFHRKLAVISENTTPSLETIWSNENLQYEIKSAGSDKNAADNRLINEIMKQHRIDCNLGYTPSKIYIITRDSDFTDLTYMLVQLGYEVHILGYGDISLKLEKVATSCTDLREVLA